MTQTARTPRTRSAPARSWWFLRRGPSAQVDDDCRRGALPAPGRRGRDLVGADVEDLRDLRHQPGQVAARRVAHRQVGGAPGRHPARRTPGVAQRAMREARVAPRVLQLALFAGEALELEPGPAVRDAPQPVGAALDRAWQ